MPHIEKAAFLELDTVVNEGMLAALSVGLGAGTVPGVTKAEVALLDHAPDVPDDLISARPRRDPRGQRPSG